MRGLALAAALALSACATAPQPKMSWAEAVTSAEPKHITELRRMALARTPPLRRLTLASSIVSFGNAPASGGICPFTVTTTTNSFSVDCTAKLTVTGGIDLQSVGSIVNAVNITAGNSIIANTNVVTPTVWADNYSVKTAGNPVKLTGNVADGATAVELIFDNNIGVSNAAAKLISVRNNGAEEGYFDKNGGYVTSSGNISAVSFGAGSALGNGLAIAGSSVVYGTAVTSNAVHIRGFSVDGASAVGLTLDNFSTLSNVGAKLVSIQNNTAERAYFDLNGALFTGATAKPVPADLTNSAATAIEHGTGTCSANSLAVTFGTAFASGTPACSCNATTATASACNPNAASNTGFTAKCAGATDTFTWTCIGLR